MEAVMNQTSTLAALSMLHSSVTVLVILHGIMKCQELENYIETLVIDLQLVLHESDLGEKQTCTVSASYYQRHFGACNSFAHESSHCCF